MKHGRLGRGGGAARRTTHSADDDNKRTRHLQRVGVEHHVNGRCQLLLQQLTQRRAARAGTRKAATIGRDAVTWARLLAPRCTASHYTVDGRNDGGTDAHALIGTVSQCPLINRKPWAAAAAADYMVLHRLV